MSKQSPEPRMEEPKTAHVLALSGSLRATSSNTILLQAMIALAPLSVTSTLYEGLGDLPHFNPDLDGEQLPTSVVQWRDALRACDGLVICSPEYAHGVPGSLKNALDWIVGSGELMEKPVALLNASLSATYAYASLTETLTVMMADVVPAASLRVPLTTNKLDAEKLLSDTAVTSALRASWAALSQAITSRRIATPDE